MITSQRLSPKVTLAPTPTPTLTLTLTPTPTPTLTLTLTPTLTLTLTLKQPLTDALESALRKEATRLNKLQARVADRRAQSIMTITNAIAQGLPTEDLFATVVQVSAPVTHPNPHPSPRTPTLTLTLDLHPGPDPNPHRRAGGDLAAQLRPRHHVAAHAQPRQALVDGRTRGPGGLPHPARGAHLPEP